MLLEAHISASLFYTASYTDGVTYETVRWYNISIY
jgi:hypothetical protein